MVVRVKVEDKIVIMGLYKVHRPIGLIRQIRDGRALIMREGTVMKVVGVKDVIGQVTVVSNKVATTGRN